MHPTNFFSLASINRLSVYTLCIYTSTVPVVLILTKLLLTVWTSLNVTSLWLSRHQWPLTKTLTPIDNLLRKFQLRHDIWNLKKLKHLIFKVYFWNFQTTNLPCYESTNALGFSIVFFFFKIWKCWFREIPYYCNNQSA